jgi:hypothetical protein
MQTVEALGTKQPSTFVAPIFKGRALPWITEMNRLSKLFLAPVAAAALVACGGGGSDASSNGASAAPSDNTPPVTTPPVTKYSQADVKNVASLGALTQIITANEVGNMLAFAGGAIQGASTNESGSNVIDAPD